MKVNLDLIPLLRVKKEVKKEDKKVEKKVEEEEQEEGEGVQEEEEVDHLMDMLKKKAVIRTILLQPANQSSSRMKDPATSLIIKRRFLPSLS